MSVLEKKSEECILLKGRYYKIGLSTDEFDLGFARNRKIFLVYEYK